MRAGVRSANAFAGARRAADGQQLEGTHAVPPAPTTTARSARDRAADALADARFQALAAHAYEARLAQQYEQQRAELARRQDYWRRKVDDLTAQLADAEVAAADEQRAEELAIAQRELDALTAVDHAEQTRQGRLAQLQEILAMPSATRLAPERHVSGEESLASPARAAESPGGGSSSSHPPATVPTTTDSA